MAPILSYWIPYWKLRCFFYCYPDSCNILSGGTGSSEAEADGCAEQKLGVLLEAHGPSRWSGCLVWPTLSTSLRISGHTLALQTGLQSHHFQWLKRTYTNTKKYTNILNIYNYTKKLADGWIWTIKKGLKSSRMLVLELSGDEPVRKCCICTTNRRPNSMLSDTAFKTYYRIIRSCRQGPPNVTYSRLLLRPSPVGAGCSGPRSVKFWVSLRLEFPQLVPVFD